MRPARVRLQIRSELSISTSKLSPNTIRPSRCDLGPERLDVAQTGCRRGAAGSPSAAAGRRVLDDRPGPIRCGRARVRPPPRPVGPCGPRCRTPAIALPDHAIRRRQRRDHGHLVGVTLGGAKFGGDFVRGVSRPVVTARRPRAQSPVRMRANRSCAQVCRCSSLTVARCWPSRCRAASSSVRAVASFSRRTAASSALFSEADGQRPRRLPGRADIGRRPRGAPRSRCRARPGPHAASMSASSPSANRVLQSCEPGTQFVDRFVTAQARQRRGQPVTLGDQFAAPLGLGARIGHIRDAGGGKHIVQMTLRRFERGLGIACGRTRERRARAVRRAPRRR